MKRSAFLALSLAALMWGNPATASSGDDWEEFRKEVRVACTAAAGLDSATELRVDPFGTESFGVAVALVGNDLLVCVFDKQTRAVELSTIPLE